MGATGEVYFSSPTWAGTDNLLRWDLSPEQIQQTSDELITKSNKVFDAVGSLDLDSVTVNNTLKALADLEAEYMVQWNMLDYLYFVSPSKEVRRATCRARMKLPAGTFVEVVRGRNDVYRRILALGLKVDEVNPAVEDKRYMERLLAGRSIQETQDSSYVQLQDQVKCPSLTFSRDELGGVPEDDLSYLEADGDKLKIKHDKCVYFMEKCFVPETRKKLGEAYNQDIMELFKECSREFKPRIDFVLNKNMVKSANKLSIFLEELAHKLKPLGDKERTNLLKLKEDECQQRSLPYDGKLYEWDLPYYKAQVENQYGVDHNQLKEYFPLEVVTQGLLDICQDLLGLSFSLVHGAPAWHPDVTLYCVTDLSSGQTIGQFYLDLFTREGMYNFVGHFDELQPGCLWSDGSRRMAIGAIVTNFSKPTVGSPLLLTHGNVVTYFHEFGHMVHYLCAQVDYAAFNGCEVETDFIEAPSRMLENWVWEKEPLQRISKHYKTGAPIPDDLLDKLIKSRLANTGIIYLENIVQYKLYQALHAQTVLDPTNECRRLSKDILGFRAFQGPIIIQICYDLVASPTMFYRYLWSEVLSMDMFYSRFKEEGIMNPKVGLDYRNCILKPGASKDAKEMLKNFLGREPNQEAFLLSKGIKVPTCSGRKLRPRCWRKD